MSIPFLWISLGFSIGILVEKYAAVPSVWAGCVLGVGILSLWFLRGKKIFLPVFVVAVICAGILWARLDAYIPSNAVQNFTGDARMTLRGVVDSLPEAKVRGKKMTVSLVLKARSITKQESGRRKFYKVNGNVQVFLLQSPFLPQVGDELRLYGTLSLPRQVLNPGEFDYGKFLALQKIHAVFQVIGKKSIRLTKQGSGFSLSRRIADLRRSIGALIDRVYGAREAAILKALVIGLRSDVAPDVRDDFFKSGTIHLLPTADGKWNYTLF